MNFDLYNVPRIVFGRGTIARLAELVPQSSRVMLVYNGRKPEIPHAVDSRQHGEPTVDDIDRALAVARDAKVDFVLGVGGGSAIDAAKAVAGLLANGGVASDYMEVVGKGQKITKPAIPWIAIPTTAGTGAEVTRNAVIGWPEKKFKASIRSELLMARVALIDPDLGRAVPSPVTAASGMDALCQCIEAYLSTGANRMTDTIAQEGVSLASQHLRRAYENGQDAEAREGMAYAALCGGIALTNAGLGAVHGFAAPIGANFPIPHGVICGRLLAPVLRANWYHSDARTRGRIETLNFILGDRAAGVTGRLIDQLNLPGFSMFGMTDADIDPMVELAKRASSMRYNPVVLPDNALREILREAL
jgi:alcohol dehydrogenase class IV